MTPERLLQRPAIVARRFRLRELIQHVRAAGYANRGREVPPHHSSTIAMPILVSGQVRASIGVTYFTAAMRSKGAVQQCIEALRVTTAGIEGEIERLRETAASDSDMPAVIPAA